MADSRDMLQTLAAEAMSFFEFVGEAIGDPLGKAALIRDLGGDPTGVPDTPPLPADLLGAVGSYRDAVHPTAEAGLQVLADIAECLDAIASNVGPWLHSADAGAQELGHSLLQLLASNWFRLHHPRWFVLFQFVSLLDELGSTYGEGTNNPVRLGHSLASLWGFLVQPGKSLEQLDGLVHPDDNVALYTDFGVRMTATILAIVNLLNKIGVTDAMTGWDGPGIDVDSPDSPAKADVISERMTSLSFGWDTGGPSSDPSQSEKLIVTTAMVPKSEGGTALFLALGGSIDIEDPISDRWKFSAKVRTDAPVAALIGSQFRLLPAGGEAFQASVGFASQPDESSDLSFTLPSGAGTRLEVGHLAFTLTIGSTGAEMLVSLADSAVVVDSGDNDGFVSEMLGHTPLRLPFGIVIGYSSSRGLVLEGTAPPTGTPAQPNAPLTGSGNVGPPVIAATIPIGRTFGAVTVHEVALRVTRGPADAAPKDMNVVTIEADTSFSAQIGPVYVRLDQLGLIVTLDGSKPPAERNLRFVDLRPDIKFPRGVAVNVETHLVAGGGSILHDADLGIYFGTMDLAFRGGLTAQAIALIATKTADGTKGFSMVLLVTLELPNPIALGMGFELQGFGALIALHRTFDEAAMRAALPTGQLRNVLFPSDPVHHTTEVLHSLETLFPGRRGSFMFGALVKVGWATPTLVQFELAVILELGNQHRLILLGRVSAVLPRAAEAIIKLNMDALGLLDFDAGTFALDAVLYESRFCGRFVLTGAMAMRMAWQGQKGFALAVGGLHPHFPRPAGFPDVARLQLALTNGDNPKLTCQAYLAITSNTVQFGADCYLYAAAFGFSIEGDVGFDVLIQLFPFHFLADFHASVQLKHGSHNLFKVSVDGQLEGPLPLRLSGKASFDILWCDYSVPFHVTLVDGGTPNDVLGVDVLTLLTSALTDPRAWHAQLPSDTGQVVSLRQPATTGILLHPLGSLTVRQSVVPLNLTRDIDRVGTGRPSTDRRFTITAASIGSRSSPPTFSQELFAPAQYFDMSDDDKLAAPSFEPMDAGVSFGEDGYTTSLVDEVAASAFAYTDIVIGPTGIPVPQPHPYLEDASRVLNLAQCGAVARSAVRRTLTRRFQAPVSAAAPTVHPTAWAAVAADGTPSPTTTWAEARGVVLAAADPSSLLLVPSAELVV